MLEFNARRRIEKFNDRIWMEHDKVAEAFVSLLPVPNSRKKFPEELLIEAVHGGIIGALHSAGKLEEAILAVAKAGQYISRDGIVDTNGSACSRLMAAMVDADLRLVLFGDKRTYVPVVQGLVHVNTDVSTDFLDQFFRKPSGRALDDITFKLIVIELAHQGKESVGRVAPLRALLAPERIDRLSENGDLPEIMFDISRFGTRIATDVLRGMARAGAIERLKETGTLLATLELILSRDIPRAKQFLDELFSEHLFRDNSGFTYDTDQYIKGYFLDPDQGQGTLIAVTYLNDTYAGPDALEKVSEAVGSTKSVPGVGGPNVPSSELLAFKVLAGSQIRLLDTMSRGLTRS